MPNHWLPCPENTKTSFRRCAASLWPDDKSGTSLALQKRFQALHQLRRSNCRSRRDGGRGDRAARWPCSRYPAAMPRPPVWRGSPGTRRQATGGLPDYVPTAAAGVCRLSVLLSDTPAIAGGASSQNHMSIGAAEAERADPGQCGPDSAGHGPKRRLHAERKLVERNVRVGLFKVQARRDFAMPERQRHLDQARDAGGGLEVAQVGLDRPEGARPSRWTVRRASTVPSAFASIGSPNNVPVPWASTY